MQTAIDFISGLDVSGILTALVVLAFAGGWVSKIIAMAFKITPGTPDPELLSDASRFFKRVVKVLGTISGDTAVNERQLDKLEKVDSAIDDASHSVSKDDNE